MYSEAGFTLYRKILESSIHFALEGFKILFLFFLNLQSNYLYCSSWHPKKAEPELRGKDRIRLGRAPDRLVNRLAGVAVAAQTSISQASLLTRAFESGMLVLVL